MCCLINFQLQNLKILFPTNFPHYTKRPITFVFKRLMVIILLSDDITIFFFFYLGKLTKTRQVANLFFPACTLFKIPSIPRFLFLLFDLSPNLTHVFT